MALAGAWVATQQGLQPYTGETKWGNGVDPIHGVYGGQGRETAPGGQTGTGGSIPEGMVDAADADGNGWSGDDGWMDDYVPQTWQPPAENDTEIGIADRPEWGSDTRDTRAAMPRNYPSYTESGNQIRNEIHGAIASSTPNVQPNESVTQGWRNKVSREQEDPGFMPPEDQTFMQTSRIQRNKVREGSQRGGGSDSEYSAPIASRTMGPKLKFWSGEQRHEDMAPKAQESIIRPFWNRSAGTGYSDWMEPNEMYVSKPRTRIAPADPAQGQDTQLDDDTQYGYVPEDATW